ncbi:MAG: fumarylacetoacetate hydrolase family protein [Alphaproteobacteria bacterium]|nr:fumarylacetoacetate hydrolase family protein [Alphaproteobacteria bacterium]
MKLITFSYRGTPKAGYIADGEAVVCVSGDRARNAIRDLVESEQGLSAFEAAAGDGAERLALSDVQLLAPMPEPRRHIFCVGKNYHAHAAEFHASGFDSSGTEEVPHAPVIFTKTTTCVVGPGESIRATLDPTQSVDYEGELAVVIGRKAFKVSRADAYGYVFGYTIMNDVTSRALQKRHQQWVIGKGLDTFGPMGPVLATADEVGDVTALNLETRVNGELRQKATIADLIFDIPTLIETMSATMTLLPGDIIATGTPVGVGIGFDPPRYLQPGDEVAISISKIGELSNPVA